VSLTAAQKATVKRHLGYHAVAQSLYPIVDGFYTVDTILSALPAETETQVVEILTRLGNIETQLDSAPGQPDARESRGRDVPRTRRARRPLGRGETVARRALDAHRHPDASRRRGDRSDVVRRVVTYGRSGLGRSKRKSAPRVTILRFFGPPNAVTKARWRWLPCRVGAGSGPAHDRVRQFLLRQ
jgi:hypothetical protein